MLLGVQERYILALLDLDQSKGNNMKNVFMRLWKEEEGQDLTEYALLLVLLSLAAIGALGTLATAINGVFTTAAGNLKAT